MNIKFRRPPKREEGARLNHRIRAREVRVIDADGAQLGIMETAKALDLARSKGLDLAEVAPTSKPPVCKIIDYGKFKYEQKKKAKTAKKNQVVIQLKEVQFRPQTDQHDRDFKVKHILRFLEDGNKVRVYVRFRGREMSHSELGLKLLNQVTVLVGDVATVEQAPKMEGRIMALILAPNAKAKAKKPKPKPLTVSKEGDEGSAAPEKVPPQKTSTMESEGAPKA